MELLKEIEILNKIYNTLSLIPTKGTDTLYMANCLNALVDVIEGLKLKNIDVETITIPMDDIQKEE